MGKTILILLSFVFINACNTATESNVTTLNKDTAQSNSKANLSKIKSDIIKTESGWGYNIIVDDKIYIHQEYIPAINGKKSFTSPEAAKKVADYAIKKFARTKKLPVISYHELDSLNVL